MLNTYCQPKSPLKEIREYFSWRMIISGRNKETKEVVKNRKTNNYIGACMCMCVYVNVRERKISHNTTVCEMSNL